MILADYPASHVLVTMGIQECRFLTLQKLGEILSATGSIGLPSVVHPGARLALGTRALALTEIPVKPDGTRLPSLAALETALQVGVRLLYLESPSRLTGAVYDEAAVQSLAELLVRYDAAAIWDQGLAPWVEGYVSLAAQPGMMERVALIGEAFPGVGLESWAVGYIGVKPDWLEPMRSQKQIMAICTSTPSQYAALAAADVYAAEHGDQRAQLANIRQAAVAQATGAGAAPLPGAAANLLALESAGDKLRAAGYSYADGADFGAPGLIRLAVMPDGAIIQGLAHL
jgi:aspartate/methionine/tyrosine aminotransferase